MNYKCIAYLFLCFCCEFVCAQNYIYKEFGIKDGLPSLEIHQLHQDNNGIIWMATDRGVASYNGYEIKTYGVNEGLKDIVVLDFYPQKDGTVYCATFNNELYYFNESFDGFKPYPHNKLLQDLKAVEQINSLYIDDTETMHIACEKTNGKFVISKDGELLEKPSSIDALDTPKHWLELNIKNDDTYFVLFQSDSTKLKKNALHFPLFTYYYSNAISLSDKAYTIFVDRNKIHISNAKGSILKTISNQNIVISLKAIDATTFFVGYEFGGGVIYDINGEIKEHFLENKSISDFLIDTDGGYWFSTLHSGIFYIKEPDIKFKPTGIISPALTLTKNAKDELYIGYRSGDVLKLNTKHQISLAYTSDEKTKALIEYDTIKRQLYVRFYDVFFRENGKGEKEYFTDSITNGFPYKISEPSAKGVLVVERGSIHQVYETGIKTYKVPYRVHDAAAWEEELYFGTPIGAYILKNDTISSLVKKDQLFQHRVDDIDVNLQRQEVYFATLGAGIIIDDKKTGAIRTITQKDGLCSDIVNEVYIKNKNVLWVCTNSGVNKVKFNEDNSFQITGFKSSDGLLDGRINDIEIIKDTIWMASQKGLMYAPKHIFDVDTTMNTYHLKLKTIQVNDAVVRQEKLQNLSHEENRIEFYVQGIYFKASNELKYTYTMEGLDDKWYHTTNRRISYPSLPYGKYIFKVKASTDAEENSGVFLEIPIQIHAPFWKQAWFIISLIAGIIVLIYLFFKYRILSYNRHIIRELLRLLVKKIKRKELYFSFKEAGKEIRIKTNTILYIKSAGNYVEIVTEQKNYTIRTKIGEFINLMPDPLEYLRIHRSYIVRIDKVAEKNSKEVTVNGEKIPVSNSYVAELNNLIF